MLNECPLRALERKSAMRRVFAVLGSALFLVLAPGIVAGLVPWWISRWRFETPGVWLAASANSWRRAGGSGNPGPIRLVCPLCDQRAGHACACFSDALP